MKKIRIILEIIILVLIFGFIGWIYIQDRHSPQKAFEECLRHNSYDSCYNEYYEPYSAVDP
jgi:lipopolysaccharide export system protein LptC